MLEPAVYDLAEASYLPQSGADGAALAEAVAAIRLGLGGPPAPLVHRLQVLGPEHMRARGRMGADALMAACRARGVTWYQDLENDLADALERMTSNEVLRIANGINVQGFANHGALRQGIQGLVFQARVGALGAARGAFKLFGSELERDARAQPTSRETEAEAASSVAVAKRVPWRAIATAVAAAIALIAGVTTILVNGQTLAGSITHAFIRPVKPAATTITAAVVISPLDGQPVLFEIVGIRNPGPPTVFRAFAVSAKFAGVTVDGEVDNVFAPIVLSSPQQHMEVICLPAESLVRRALAPVPQGGAVSGTLLVSFPGVDIRSIDYSTLKTTFEDVDGEQYEARPLSPETYGKVQLPADSCRFVPLPTASTGH